MAHLDPSVLAHQLCKLWGQAPQLKVHPCPDHRQLASIIECAYLASLESEEGRPLKFALILWPSNEGTPPGFGIARFRERRPLNVDEIRRLAPATGLATTFIAVEPTEEEPIIWGTVDAGCAWMPSARAERTSGILMYGHLAITVSAPGTMKLSFSDSLLFSAERGQGGNDSCNVLKFGPVHEYLQPVMQSLHREAFPDKSDHPADKWNDAEYLRFLARVLIYAEEFGHGGTIIVLRDDDYRRVDEYLDVKYALSESLQLWEDLVRYLRLKLDETECFKLIDGKPEIDGQTFKRWRMASRDGKRAEERLIDRSRFLARLTQVDGALVLTQRLRVLGFGAVIKNLSAAPQSFKKCQDELCRRYVVSKTEAYGTRHKSAMALCRQLDCLVFVLSHDGGVKALRRDGDEVLLWPSVDLGIHAWFVTSADWIPELRPPGLRRGSARRPAPVRFCRFAPPFQAEDND
jgi:hypothetical protein